MGGSAAGEPELHMNPRNLAETGRFLSDTRYVLGGVAVLQGKPMFRWQQADGTTESRRAGNFGRSKVLEGRITGSMAELRVLKPYGRYFGDAHSRYSAPDGFFSAWRMADRLGPALFHACDC